MHSSTCPPSAYMSVLCARPTPGGDTYIHMHTYMYASYRTHARPRRPRSSVAGRARTSQASVRLLCGSDAEIEPRLILSCWGSMLRPPPPLLLLLLLPRSKMAAHAAPWAAAQGSWVSFIHCAEEQLRRKGACTKHHSQHWIAHIGG